MINIRKLEAELWESADLLRAHHAAKKEYQKRRKAA